MVTPETDAEAHRGASDRLDVPADALIGRLQRRITALERQLDARIAQIADLQAQLRLQAAEYDALMATRTMRALRLPRAIYAQARRRLHR